VIWVRCERFSRLTLPGQLPKGRSHGGGGAVGAARCRAYPCL
jgi:hypothetical protein